MACRSRYSLAFGIDARGDSSPLRTPRQALLLDVAEFTPLNQEVPLWHWREAVVTRSWTGRERIGVREGSQ